MFRWIAIMAAIALTIGAAYAQSSSDQPTQPTLPLGSNQTMGHRMMHQGGPSMMDPAMMQMMHMMHMTGSDMMGHDMMGPGMTGQDMMGPVMCRGQAGMAGMSGTATSYLEARLAFVRSELAIDQAQESGWQKYAEALRGEAKSMSERMSGMHHAKATDLDFPARLDARVTMLEGRLSGLKAVREAAVALYGQLNPEQKRKADGLLPMSLCM